MQSSSSAYLKNYEFYFSPSSMTIIISLLILGILIFVHELGHFLFAKWNGVGVLEFSIGFGKKIWKHKRGDTTYSIGLIPLGGYVRMVGDDPSFLETMGDTEADNLNEDELRLLRDKSKWFLNKRYLPKLSIVAAGPGFNLLFAVFLALFSFMVFGVQNPVNSPIIGDLIPNYPAESAGLKPLDTVLEINGTKTPTWEVLAGIIHNSGGKKLDLLIERQGEKETPERMHIEIQGQLDSSELQILNEGNSKDSYKLGILPKTERAHISFMKALPLSFYHVWYISKVTLKGMYAMVRGLISPKNIAGPIFIFSEAGKSAKKGFANVIDFMIFLSVSLAVLNLLPIPVLDGGHILFFTIEALKGSPVKLRYQQFANQIGMFLLLALMVFALGNDILRLTGK